MLAYLVKRILYAIPTIAGVAVLVFFMLRVIPGDIVELKLRGDGAAVSEEMLQAERARLGLDKPLHEQFADWMVGLATLDLGKSMWTELPVSEEIGTRLGLTLQVAIMATILAVLIALPLGIASALYKDTLIDHTIRLVTIAGLAVPSFWLGMIIILILLSTLNWLPPVTYTPFYVDPWANISQLIWPALAIGFRYSAVLTRMIRSSIIEVMQEDYIRTARAKGVNENKVIGVHALRNALLPFITVLGLEFAFLIGGLVVTEQVFNLNGLGRLFVQAVTRNDFTLVQGIVMLIAVIFIVTNLIVDLLYAAIDPRIRYGAR
jgi:peptide/nickel transport system permease protein